MFPMPKQLALKMDSAVPILGHRRHSGLVPRGVRLLTPRRVGGHGGVRRRVGARARLEPDSSNYSSEPLED